MQYESIWQSSIYGPRELGSFSPIHSCEFFAHNLSLPPAFPNCQAAFKPPDDIMPVEHGALTAITSLVNGTVVPNDSLSTAPQVPTSSLWASTAKIRQISDYVRGALRHIVFTPPTSTALRLPNWREMPTVDCITAESLR